MVAKALTSGDDAPPMSARAAVSVILYGQSDPDHVTAAGLHGLGGGQVKVALEQTGTCRFTVAAAGKSETIDFSRVSNVRYAELADPADGLAGIFAPRPGGSAGVRRLTVAIVEGTPGAVCGAAGCEARRLFAVTGTDRQEAARATAWTVLSRLCREARRP